MHTENYENFDTKLSAENESINPSEIQLVTNQSFEKVVGQADKDVLVVFDSESADSYSAQVIQSLVVTFILSSMTQIQSAICNYEKFLY